MHIVILYIKKVGGNEIDLTIETLTKCQTLEWATPAAPLASKGSLVHVVLGLLLTHSALPDTIPPCGHLWWSVELNTL